MTTVAPASEGGDNSDHLLRRQNELTQELALQIIQLINRNNNARPNNPVNDELMRIMRSLLLAMESVSGKLQRDIFLADGPTSTCSMVMDHGHENTTQCLTYHRLTLTPLLLPIDLCNHRQQPKRYQFGDLPIFLGQQPQFGPYTNRGS